MPFKYLRDPLFLAAVAAYLLNRFAIKPVVVGGFFHDHLNDLICIPVWVPVMLWGMRRAGLRQSNHPPAGYEIAVPLVIWSWAFEVFLPAVGWLGPLCVADHRDVMYYAAGAVVSAAFWSWWYAPGAEVGKAGPSPSDGQGHRPAVKSGP